MGHIRGTVFVGRGPDSNENYLHHVDTFPERCGEMQSAVGHILVQQILQAVLVDGQDTFLQIFYFMGVDIHTPYVSAHLGETCTGYQADVSAADNSYIHVQCLI